MCVCVCVCVCIQLFGTSDKCSNGSMVVICEGIESNCFLQKEEKSYLNFSSQELLL